MQANLSFRPLKIVSYWAEEDYGRSREPKWIAGPRCPCNASWKCFVSKGLCIASPVLALSLPAIGMLITIGAGSVSLSIANLRGQPWPGSAAQKRGPNMTATHSPATGKNTRGAEGEGSWGKAKTKN